MTNDQPVGVVADTMVISWLFDDRPSLVADRYRDPIGPAPVLLAFHTVMELRYGALRARWGELRRRRIERRIAELTIVQPDDETITVCADLRLRCRQIAHALSDKLQVRDGRGHEESIATVQLDFNQPERFDLSYIAADGGRHRPVMIHRGTVGAMERVVATLLERYQGRLPLWLAPVQLCVLPVAPAQVDAARPLPDAVRAAGLRAVIEVEGSLGARVRASRQRRDCVIAVIGEKEVAADLGGSQRAN